MKVKIIEIGKDDAWYPYRDNIIGNIGELIDQWQVHEEFIAGEFSSDDPIHCYGDEFSHKSFIFSSIKIQQIK